MGRMPAGIFSINYSLQIALYRLSLASFRFRLLAGFLRFLLFLTYF